MKYPKTNELRHKIDLYNVVQTLDSYGQSVSTYTLAYSKVPAKLTIKSSRESYTTDKLVSSYETQFIVRFNQPVSDKMIIKYEGNNYSIFDVSDREGTRKMKTITAFTTDDQGLVE